jgi:hypothetical protein
MPSTRTLSRACPWAVSVLLLTAVTVTAQPPTPGLPTPRLLTVMPPGGKAGTTVEVTFTGQNLEDPERLLFSHPGIKGEPIAPPPPPPPDPKAPKPAMAAPKAAVTKFKVTIPADAPLGHHDVRFVNKYGGSNPRAFVVGDLNEVLEKEPNNDVPQAQRIDLNTTVNGTIASNVDVDYYVFAGKRGQRVLMSCLTSTIDSRSHPGLDVYDAKGRQLASNRFYQHNDALADVTLPEDGDYYVRVYEFTYTQGNAEYFYRLSVSTAPWIDAVFPPMVEPGKTAQLTVYGRNLPGGKPDPEAVVDGRVLDKLTVSITAPADPAAAQRLHFSGHLEPHSAALDGFEYRIKNEVGTSNPFLLTFAKAPVVLDQGDNDLPEKAQEIAVPCEIAGRIEKRHDRDWYAFTAKKGDVLHVEAFSDRLGSPTDVYFRIHNPATKQDVFSSPEDNNEILSPKFFSRSEDPPPYRFVVPADGKYQLFVSSRSAHSLAGPRHFYRVRITPEQPDFRLIVMAAGSTFPDAPNLRQGGNQFLTVFAWREDGFNGPVELAVEGLPKGVTCPPQTLGSGLRHTLLGLHADADAPSWTGTIKVTGTASIKGVKVTREARPGSITWPLQQPQPNIPAIARVDHDLSLAVRDAKSPFALTATFDKPAYVQGDKATINLKVARLWPDFKGPVNVVNLPNPQLLPQQPPYLPPGLNLPAVNVAADKTDATLAVNVGTNLPPGTYNLVLLGQAQVPYNKDPMAKQKPNVNFIEPSNPLVLTVVPKTLANVSLANANLMAKVGTQTELVVKLARQFDYAGEFKVQVVLPPNTKGVSADEVTVPAGQNEAKVVLKIAADAMPTSLKDLVVKITGSFNGTVPTTQEAKFTVNVVK